MRFYQFFAFSLLAFVLLISLSLFACTDDDSSDEASAKSDDDLPTIASAEVGDDDDNNDDDDNDDDNDTVPEGGPLIFAGPAFEFVEWNMSLMDATSFLWTGTGWVEYPIYSVNKGLLTLMTIEVSPLCTINRTTSFAKVDISTTLDGSSHMIYKFDRDHGWRGAYTAHGDDIYDFRAFSEDEWYILIQDELDYYNQRNVTPIPLPEIEKPIGMFFVSQGNGIVFGVKKIQSGQTGIYYLFRNNVITSNNMPSGSINEGFTDVWLYDIDNGWAFSADVTYYSKEARVKGGSTLWRLSNGRWSQVSPPPGCNNMRLSQMAFADENFGVITTRTNKYLLYNNGTWSCETIPIIPGDDSSFVHVVDTQHYYIGVNNLLRSRIIEFDNGVMTELALPIAGSAVGLNLYYGIMTIGRFAPNYSRVYPGSFMEF